MTRDDAVRVVAGALHDATCDAGCPARARHSEAVYAPKAPAVVDALVAAGWGDLAAERERLAAAVEAEAIRLHDAGDFVTTRGLDRAARLIRHGGVA